MKNIQSKNKHVVVLTGSGISADSGLQTFRDHGGLWAGYRVEDVATPEAFKRQPQQVLEFYNRLRRQLLSAQPNEAHKALAELECYYSVNIITQNVDDLHERAGSSEVLHLHGELLKARSSVDENYVVDCLEDQTLDDTDGNGYPMRPYIVWFGEAVPLLDDAIQLMHQADIVIVIGTSLQVYPAASLLQFTPVDAEIFFIDPHPPQGLGNVNIIRERAPVGVSLLVKDLIKQSGSDVSV